MKKTPSERNRFSPILLLATGLGFGYSRIMPGTVGALWGLPLAWGISQIPAVGPLPAWSVQAGVILLGLVVGIPLCTAAAAQIGKKDPSSVVYDEIATMPIVYFLLPTGDMARPWVWVAGFVLHRFFDILKPPPCRQLEQLPDGLGIMADDVAAAVYACGVLHLLVWLAGRI